MVKQNGETKGILQQAKQINHDLRRALSNPDAPHKQRADYFQAKLKAANEYLNAILDEPKPPGRCPRRRWNARQNLAAEMARTLALKAGVFAEATDPPPPGWKAVHVPIRPDCMGCANVICDECAPKGDHPQ